MRWPVLNPAPSEARKLTAWAIVGDVGVALHRDETGRNRVHGDAERGQFCPADLGHRGFGLRAGGVEDQHINRAEALSDRGGQPGDLLLVGDIGAEALGGPALGPDAATEGGDLFIAGPAIDRDRKAVTGQAPRDHRPQAPRAARHQRDPPMRDCHVMIPLCATRRADASARRARRVP